MVQGNPQDEGKPAVEIEPVEEGQVGPLGSAEGYYQPSPARPSGCSSKSALMVIVAAFLLFCIAGPILVCSITGGGFSNFINNVRNGIGGLFSSQPATANVVSTQTIVQGIQTMGQLVTISVQLAKADIAVSVRQGVLNAASFTVNHVAQGTVEAGIDLTQIDEASIHYDEAARTYTITLPPAQLTSCRIDYIRQYDYAGTILTVDLDAARILANYIALIEFRDDTIEGGILDRAQREAEQVLGTFIQALTGSEVVFEYTDAEAALPPSCQPDPPDTWVYDAAENAWTRP